MAPVCRPKKLAGGKLGGIASDPLGSVGPGTRVRVERVSDDDPAVSRQLAEIGVVPGTEVTVGGHDPDSGRLWVQCGPRRHGLGRQAVAAIYVSVLSGGTGGAVA